MGLLNRLFGSKPTFAERVWMTEALKFDDVVRQARGDTGNESVSSLIVYHFPHTGVRLRSRLDESALDYKDLKRPGTETLENLTGVGLLHSEDIPGEIKRGEGRRSSYASDTPCRVHLAEHYPLSYRDDEVLGLHSILAGGSQFFCYVGLDEAWLEKVLGSSTRRLLDELGIRDDEPLNHAMIGAALRRAQAQFDKTRRNIEHYAGSCAEWVELNMSE